MTDNHEAAKTEAALNERRLAQRGWPVTTLDGEVMIVGEKVVNGERYLKAGDRRLFSWRTGDSGWKDSGFDVDAEAVPGDTEDEEPDASPPVLADTTDVGATDLAEITASALSTPEALKAYRQEKDAEDNEEWANDIAVNTTDDTTTEEE